MMGVLILLFILYPFPAGLLIKTLTKDLKAEVAECISVFGAEFFHDDGQITACGFRHLAAFQADDMQVISYTPGLFVVGVLVSKIDLGDEIEPEKEIKGVIDRSP
jgi:hypothetical protein